MNSFDETYDPEGSIVTAECTQCGDNFLLEREWQTLCIDCMETLPLNEVIGRAV